MSIPRQAECVKLGYSFKDFDTSLRATWKFLREATAEQVQAQITRVLQADNKLTNGTVLNRLFNSTVQLNEWGHTCYGLWSGDSMVPRRISARHSTAPTVII